MDGFALIVWAVYTVVACVVCYALGRRDGAERRR